MLQCVDSIFCWNIVSLFWEENHPASHIQSTDSATVWILNETQNWQGEHQFSDIFLVPTMSNNRDSSVSTSGICNSCITTAISMFSKTYVIMRNKTKINKQCETKPFTLAYFSNSLTLYLFKQCVINGMFRSCKQGISIECAEILYCKAKAVEKENFHVLDWKHWHVVKRYFPVLHNQTFPPWIVPGTPHTASNSSANINK